MITVGISLGFNSSQVGRDSTFLLLPFFDLRLFYSVIA
jgi:hypothetical protein